MKTLSIEQMNELIKEFHETALARYPKVFYENGKTIYSMDPEHEIHVYNHEEIEYTFFKNGNVHNAYGPAISRYGKTDEYYLFGEPIEKNEWEFWRKLYV